MMAAKTDKLPESVTRIWREQEALAQVGNLTVGEQLQAFWDSVAPISKDQLTRRCPYFDPQHEVWLKHDSRRTECAMQELSRIMVDCRISELSAIGRAWIIAFVVYCGLVFLIYGDIYYRANVLGKPRSSGLYLVFGIGGLLGMAAFLAPRIYFANKATKFASAAPALSYTSVARATGGGEAFEPYSKCWAATEHWKMRRQEAHHPLFLWYELSRPLQDGQLTRREMLQIHWDALLPADHDWLTGINPMFDPAHDAWAGNSSTAAERTELELTLIMLGKLFCKFLKAFFLMGVVFACFALAWLGDLVTSETFLVVSLGFVVPTIVAISRWRTVSRERAQAQSDLAALASV